MKKATSIFLAISFFSIMFYAGCKDTITADQVDSVVIPSSNVSYSKYIQPVLNLKCATGGCHDDITKQSGISFTTWSNTVANPNVVFPGKPENSSIVYSIKGQAPYQPMPPPNSGIRAMTNNQVDGVTTWIKEGAKNN